MEKIYFCFMVCFLICLSSGSLALKGGWDTVEHLSYNLMKETNFKVHDTKLFRYRSGLHVRHDLEIHLALKPHGDHCDDEPFKFWLIENGNISVFTWTQRPLVQNGEFHFHLYVNKSIPIGQYTLNSSVPYSKEKGKTAQLCDVNVIFNPRLTQWNASSFDDKRIRRQTTSSAFNDEYLNNNYGYIWKGSRAIPWNYAVGSQVVTDSKNRLTRLMSRTERSSEVEYSRALSKLIGNNVLYGRWNGYYDDGVEPSQWVGSEEILTRWLQSGLRVRYAQCWVFAAILTTILRASGIPARTVTNYRSHHDRGLTDNRMAVLRQYDNKVQPDEPTWNYHVWTEAWLQRLDLGQTFNWNALDATPQEPSPLAPNQPFRAGPAYVPFIRSNMRTALYDTLFILAEVNTEKTCPTTGRVLPEEARTTTRVVQFQQSRMYYHQLQNCTRRF